MNINFGESFSTYCSHRASKCLRIMGYIAAQLSLAFITPTWGWLKTQDVEMGPNRKT